MPTPSPPTICAAPAPFRITLPPTNGCSRSSCECFIAAKSTSSSWQTKRSPNSKPPQLPDQPEPAMEAAIDRIMMAYDLLMNRTAVASAEARAQVTDYLNTLFEAGERDTHRLTVCGLTYLRELDGSSDPVKAGYTGL